MKTFKQLTEELDQIDESLLNTVFQFMWNATAKIVDKVHSTLDPDGFRDKQTREERNRFVNKMTDENIDKWMDALHSKLKSDHPRTAEASAKRQAGLRRAIQQVKKAQTELGYRIEAQRLNNLLKQYRQYIASSNKRQANKKR